MPGTPSLTKALALALVELIHFRRAVIHIRVELGHALLHRFEKRRWWVLIDHAQRRAPRRASWPAR
jgi:hypothetical protein